MARRGSPRSPQPKTPFGRWLTEQLERQDITLTEVARRIDLPLATVARWRYHNHPNLENATRLAGVLGIPVSDVMVAAGQRERHHEPDQIRAELHQLINLIDDPLLVPLLPMLRGLHAQSRQGRAETIALLRAALERHD